MAEKSHTKPWQRVAVFAIAILFILTSAALTIGVVVQSATSNNKPKSTSNNQSKQLAGTKLAGFTPVNSVPKLQVIDTKVGSGKVVKAGDTVTVDYTGAVAATGIIFQSSLDTGQPVPLSLKQVIEGWQKGIPGMKVGGTRRLLIPAPEAYGNTPPPSSGIPVNAPLVFDITLHAIGS